MTGSGKSQGFIAKFSPYLPLSGSGRSRMATSAENQTRADRATEWFDQAKNNIQVAKRISRKRRLKPQAIFHLQQAMEMAVKGLAAASGYSYDKLKNEFSHNYVDLYISLLEETLGQSGLADRFSEVLSVFYVEGPAYDAPSHLSNVRDHVQSPGSARAKLTDADWRAIYLSAFRISEDEVNKLIRLYDSANQNHALASAGFVLFREQIALELGIPAHAVSRSDMNKALKEHTRYVKALLGLLIFGCIFWPHNMPARYPAPPETHHDVFQVSRFGLMGVQHYSDSLGVVKCLKVLQECCEEVVKILLHGQRHGVLFMTKEDVELL